MAFPVVQEAIESSTATASTSHVVTLPTATAGQLLLIILDKGATSATINALADLTELLDENLANGLYIAYRWMDGIEPASYTLTSSASTRSAHIAYRISGAENPATQAPQIGTTGTGTSATPDPPASAAPGSTKDYLFIAFAGMAGEEADDDTWGNTPPTNYTPSPPRQKACGIAGTNLGGLILSAERALNTGAAENPGTFGVDVSAAWRAQTITVHPASAPPPITGDAASTQAVQASAATGSEAFDGTVASTQAVQASAATGTNTLPANTGTVASTQSVQVSAAVGSFVEPVTGTTASVQATQISAGVGVLRYSGALASTQAVQSSAATGTLTLPPFTGTVASAQAVQVSAAIGSVLQPFTGTTASTQAVQVLAVVGTVVGPFVGTIASLQATQTSAGIATNSGYVPPADPGAVRSIIVTASAKADVAIPSARTEVRHLSRNA